MLIMSPENAVHPALAEFSQAVFSLLGVSGKKKSLANPLARLFNPNPNT